MVTQTQIEKAVEEAADKFQAWYLDYVNDFISIPGYAIYYGISVDEAENRIQIGRKIHNQRTTLI